MIDFADVKYYDIDEVAGILKVRRQTVYGYIWQGKMETYRIGRRTYVSEQELKDFIGSGHRESEHRVSKGERRQPMR